MKKVLATGLNGMYESTAYLGSMDCFNRMRKNMNNSHDYSSSIDALGRNFVDDDYLSLTQFSSVTSVPPDVMTEVSAIVCMSCPEIMVQVLSIAEHYSIPIVVASTGGLVDEKNQSEDLSELNAKIMLNISQKQPVVHCRKNENPFDALKIIVEEDIEAGFYNFNSHKLKAD